VIAYCPVDHEFLQGWIGHIVEQIHDLISAVLDVYDNTQINGILPPTILHDIASTLNNKFIGSRELRYSRLGVDDNVLNLPATSGEVEALPSRLA
jgi:hypothetical protein